MPNTANLNMVLPEPNVSTGWGGTLNTDFTIIDNVFSASGTPVSMNIGSGKTLAVGGTLLLGSGDGTGSISTPTIRGPAIVGSNLAGSNITFQASNGTGTGGSGRLIFQTAPAGSSGTTPNTMRDALTIGNNNRVGIGTSTPDDTIEIYNATATDTFLRAKNVVSSSPRTTQVGTDSSGNGILFTKGSNPLLLGTNDTERFRIGESGQLGIGGANYGTSGQVLTSKGAGSPPAWENAGSGGGSQITVTTAQACSGASNIDFNSVPDPEMIQVVLSGVSLNGANNLLIYLGTASGVEASGYTSTTQRIASTLSVSTSTLGFIISSGSTSSIISGTVTISKTLSNSWVCSYSLIDTGQSNGIVGGGFKTTSSAVTRIRISPGGTNLFSAGIIRVTYFK